MAISIRPIERDQAQAVIGLWRAAGITRPWNDPEAEIAAALACPSATILAACDGDMSEGQAGAMVGTVMAGYDGHRGWLYSLAVAEAARGRGIGRALVEAAEAWLRGQGAPKVRLMVRDENARAAGFYVALGYERQPVAVLGKPLDGG